MRAVAVLVDSGSRAREVLTVYDVADVQVGNIGDAAVNDSDANA